MLLSTIGNYASENGVIFCLEPNPAIYGTNFLNTTKEALQFCKRLNNNGIGVNLDFGTIIANGESLDFSSDELDLIKHVHISEVFLMPIEERQEHYLLKEVLSSTNYSGCVSVEMRNTGETNDIINAALYLLEVYS